MIVDCIRKFLIVAIVNDRDRRSLVFEPWSQTNAVLVVTDAFVLCVKLSDDFLQIGHFLDLACDVGLVWLQEFLLRSVVLENESDLFVFFLQGNYLFDHLLVDDSNGDWVFPVSQVIFQIQGVCVILHQNIVFRSYVLDLIFLAMFNDQHD